MALGQRVLVAASFSAGLWLSTCGSAFANSATFNFNSLAENATAAQIQTYMDGVLAANGCTGCSVTVTGAFADQTWNADKHVTGPGTGSTSLTLGNSNGATSSTTTSTLNPTYDTFLATVSDGGASDSQITMKFNGFTVNGSSSFDYEIFPDGTCPVLTSASCGGNPTNGIYPNQPDMHFEAGTNTTGTDPVVSSFGTNGVQYGVTPGTTNGNATHSPLGAETAPQYIGTWSGSVSNATELDFVDWPAAIGIDNLVVSFTPPTGVPEPGSLVLLGTVIAAIGLRKKLKKAKA